MWRKNTGKVVVDEPKKRERLWLTGLKKRKEMLSCRGQETECLWFYRAGTERKKKILMSSLKNASNGCGSRVYRKRNKKKS